jgi:hypothetical protein
LVFAVFLFESQARSYECLSLDREDLKCEKEKSARREQNNIAEWVFFAYAELTLQVVLSFPFFFGSQRLVNKKKKRQTNRFCC